MRLVRRIDFASDDEAEDDEPKSWLWYERPLGGDTDGSRSSQKSAVFLTDHVADVCAAADRIVRNLPLPTDIANAVRLAAKWHDLGKARPAFQRLLGNLKCAEPLLAKSGPNAGRLKLSERYRHEFGSVDDILDETQSYLAEFQTLSPEMQDLVLHLIAAHHGRARPHFPADEATHPANGRNAPRIAAEVPRRFARLQRRYGRWGLAYLESLLRAADYAASANPTTNTGGVV